MSKTIIIPIVAFLAVVLKLAFHIDLSDVVQGQIVNNVYETSALVALLYGIITNHKK